MGSGFRHRLARLATHSVMRRAWTMLRGFPLVGGLAHRVSAALLPQRVWYRIAAGPAVTFEMSLDVRYDFPYARGHEPWTITWLTHYLRPGDTFLDVGAHAGSFSLLAARLVGPTGRVIAIEPDPQNLDLLRANIARNGCSAAVQIVAAAAAARDGTVRFARASAASSRVQGQLVGIEDATAIEIPAVQLDAFAALKPRLIKVDVEGGEINVLKGAPGLLSDGAALWTLERHTAATEAWVRSRLLDCRYTLKEVQPPPLGYSANLPRWIIAVPCDRPEPTEPVVGGARA
ncbi:MAG: FkbM family methyltransferase [bacterium]